MKATEVYKPYYDAMLSMLPKHLRPFIDDDVQADEFWLIFQHSECVGGYGLTYHPEIDMFEINGLFALVNNGGRLLVSHAIERASSFQHESTVIRVSCFDPLQHFYKLFGFMSHMAEPFVDALASTGWDYERFGRPDMYTMILKVDKRGEGT